MTEKPGSIQRLVSLDLLKVYGILMMVQGHTLDALLGPAAKATAIYHFMTYLRGFTAPAFLFAAGTGLIISASRRPNTKPLPNLLNRLRHLFPIIAFAYFLHLPYLSLYRMLFRTTPADVAQFFYCDILQVIAFTIIGVQVAMIFIRKISRLAAFSLVTGAVCFVLTPFFAMITYPNQIPIFIFQLISRAGGTLFPLFPFSSYLLFGVGAGYLVARGTFRNPRAKYILIAAAAALLAAGWLLGRYGYSPDRLTRLFSLHGSLVTQRTAGVALIWGLFMLFENRSGWLLKALTDIGKASFLVYVVHIVMVFGSVLGPGLTSLWGARLGFGPAGVIAAFVVASMCALGLFWIWLKDKYPVSAKWIRNAIWFALLGTFLVKPF